MNYEQDIMKDLANGDSKALELIIEEYHTYVTAIVRTILSEHKNDADIQGVVNEVFFLLWKKRLIPRSMELVGTFRNSARITPTSIGTRKPAADFTTPITEPRFIRRTNMVTPAIVTINGCFNVFSIRFYFLLL